MWPKRSHVLKPLTDLIGKTNFVWNKEHQQAFEKMKAIVSTDCLLCFPDHNLPFVIETDASDFQLGSITKQEGNPVAYYSRIYNNQEGIIKYRWNVL